MNTATKRRLILASAIIIIIILIVSIILICVSKNKKEELNVTNSKYNEKAVTIMKEKNLYDKINGQKYFKTIEVLLEDNLLEEKYLDSYYKIDYVNINDFSKNINVFLDKNYTPEEINYIFSDLKDNLDVLLNTKYIDILKFKELSNFDNTKLERYLNYLNKNDYDLKTAVTYVNIGLDLKGYSEYTEYTVEEAEKDLTILVNKYHKLPDNYEPSDLVSLSYNENYKLRKEAAQAFEKLTSAGLIDNVIFYPFSPYRSFKTQEVLYNRYKDRDGIDKADTYSARPGFSEHQLGLAVDVRSNTLSDNLTSNDYEWMLNNAHKYGFIIRYPKGKQKITQFIEEPWHLRYLGIELATKVHDSNLTYDEYYDLYIENN